MLNAEDLLPGGSSGEPHQEKGAAAPLVVPAGVFSALDKAGRRRVLATLHERPVLVCGLPLECSGRLVRLLGRVRMALTRARLHAGEPGDGVLHAVVGMPPGPTHYFSTTDLVCELQQAGLLVSSAGLRASDCGPIVCAQAGPGVRAREA